MLFAPERLVHDAGWFAVWRRDHVLGVRIDGELDDTRNPIWRAWVDAHAEKNGWPRFMALDVRTVVPAASLPKRIQSAMWGKKVLGEIEWGVIGAGKDARVGLTVRAILRIVGMHNVSVVHEDEAFQKYISKFVAGGSGPWA